MHLIYESEIESRNATKRQIYLRIWINQTNLREKIRPVTCV